MKKRYLFCAFIFDVLSILVLGLVFNLSFSADKAIAVSGFFGAVSLLFSLYHYIKYQKSYNYACCIFLIAVSYLLCTWMILLPSFIMTYTWLMNLVG